MVKIIENVPIRTQVLEQMRALIITNTIPPGDRLFEEKLAAEMGVSRTPVREALHVLEREGFLEAIPRVGYIVRTPEIEDFEEIIEIRKALESLTALWASQRMNKGIINQLNQNMKKSDAAIKRGDMRRFVNLNEDFHEIIDRASGRKRICEMSQSLRYYMYFYMMASIIDKTISQKALADHRKITEALKSKNEAKIREEIYLHLDGLKNDLLTYFKNNSPPQKIDTSPNEKKSVL